MSCRRWRCGSRDCCCCWWYFRANRIIVVSSLDARSGDSKLMLHAAFCFCFSFFLFFFLSIFSFCCCWVYNNSWKCSNNFYIGNFYKSSQNNQNKISSIQDQNLNFLISKIIKNNLTFIRRRWNLFWFIQIGLERKKISCFLLIIISFKKLYFLLYFTYLRLYNFYVQILLRVTVRS